MTAAAQVRQARHARGWTQRTLAVRAGVPQSTVGRIEAGLVDPRSRTVDRLLRACERELQVGSRAGEGVDRSQLRELLRMSPAQRLALLTSAASSMSQLWGRARPR